MVDDLADWPAQAGLDSNTLLGFVGPFAQEMVRRDGFVVPCGAGLTLDGVVEPFMTDPSGFASVEEAYRFLLAGVTANRDSWRAVCLVSVIPGPGDDIDALRFVVDHASGHCLLGLVEVAHARISGNVSFGSLEVVPVPPLVWADDGSPG